MKVEGSVCEDCYACNGRYRFPNVEAAMDRRLKGLSHPLWSKAVSDMIRNHVTIGTPYFRFFDSGDLQNEAHLMKIFAVCNENPEIAFWLPTRERVMVKNVLARYPKPNNLVIRFSSAMINARPLDETHTSTVVSTSIFTCQAPSQNGECGMCRMCWDPAISNVAYKLH